MICNIKGGCPSRAATHIDDIVCGNWCGGCIFTWSRRWHGFPFCGCGGININNWSVRHSAVNKWKQSWSSLYSALYYFAAMLLLVYWELFENDQRHIFTWILRAVGKSKLSREECYDRNPYFVMMLSCTPTGMAQWLVQPLFLTQDWVQIPSWEPLVTIGNTEGSGRYVLRREDVGSPDDYLDSLQGSRPVARRPLSRNLVMIWRMSCTTDESSTALHGGNTKTACSS